MAVSLPILSCAPSGAVTAYDRDYATIYLRLLDAEAAGAHWREVAEIVMGLGPDVAEDEVRRIHESHLARARWLRDGAYIDLLKLPFDPDRDG